MDVHESPENNQVTATFELPDVKKEDVQIDIQSNRLTISGEAKASKEHNEEGYALRERRYGKFSRTLPLPQGIKVSLFFTNLHLTQRKSNGRFCPQNEEIKASMNDGVLMVTFPKSAPEASPKKITIA